MAASEDTETRFSHLLQPIRDLADNWNIDIAAELEEYLGELEKITFSFDGVSQPLNFAEGSACIYSKKVEYLYQLMYKTLDFLVQKRKKNESQQSSITADGTDKDIEQPEEPEFLLLDDLEEAEGIDLVETNNPRNGPREPKYSANSLAILLGTNNGRQAEEMNEGSNGVGDRRSDFRINTCALHPSGALLLEEKDKERLDASLEMSDSQALSQRLSVQYSSRKSSQGQLLSSQTELPIGSGVPASTRQTLLDNSIQDVDSGPLAMDFGGHSDDDDFAEPPGVADDREEEGEREGMVQQQANESETTGRKRSRRKQRIEEDDWVMLDPHEPADPKLVKPFKKGKTYRLPAVLGGKGRKEKPAEEKEEEEQPPALSIVARSFRESFFPEFDYITARVNKIKHQHITERRKMREAMMTKTTWVRKELALEEEEEEEEALEFQFGAAVGYNESDSDDLNVEPIAMDAVPEEQTTQENVVAQSYEDLCRSHVEQYLESVENYVQDSALSLRISEWRRRLNPIIQIQENRTSFDIHKYGHDLVENLSRLKKKEAVPFPSLVGKAEPYEVCRNFAAALQLVNNGNVELLKDKNTLTVKLLSAEFRDISSYRVPSMKSKQKNKGEKENLENSIEIMA